MRYRTSLGRVRGLGAAKSGTEHWWQERVTSAAGIPLVLFLIWLALRVAGDKNALETYDLLASSTADQLIGSTPHNYAPAPRTGSLASVARDRKSICASANTNNSLQTA